MVALVTGASRGIGRTIALRLASDGAAVVINYKGNADAARRVVAKIESLGGRASAVPADVSKCCRRGATVRGSPALSMF